ncbi:MAG: ACT domain-containing protein [Alphaproteobacteria bacterium]|nr:ACT domain-containing protein [Alphaproteobacteria bacterium]
MSVVDPVIADVNRRVDPLRSETWTAFRAAAARIAGVAGDATGADLPRARADAARALKAALTAELKADFDAGVPGDVVAARRAAAVDEALRQLLQGRDDVAVTGVGGYGRGLLAPFSDVDLLFLTRDDPKAARSAVETTLYVLWDAGLVVGNAAHDVAGAVAACKADVTTCTSYLDARLVAGDPRLHAAFSERYDAYRRRSAKRFTKEKLAEFRERRRDYDRAGRHLEPNLKEMRGGLRDIDTVGWIYRYLTGVDPWSADGLEDLVDAEEADRLKKARSHLWSVRGHLHDIVGRADDQVTFDLQPLLASRLGYADRRRAAAAERLMKHLRLNALTAARLVRVCLARLEERTAELAHWRPRGTPQPLRTDEMPGRVNVTMRTNRLDFLNKAEARRTPADLFRIFRARAKRPDLGLHPDAIELIASSARRLTDDVRGDAEIAELFLAMIERAREPLTVLQDMSECGLLGAYLPSLRRVTGQVEYGLYRRYSIEETIFRSIDAYAGLRYRDLAESHPIAASLLKRKARRRAALVAILLQETSWAVADRSTEHVERAARRIARRFLSDERQVADVAWCAARPDRLIVAAERRNIGADETILDFAADVGSVARLETLLVLTVCRHLVVSENRWNAWTRRQVGAMFFGARAALAGGAPALAAFRREEEAALVAALREAAPFWSAKEAQAYAARLVEVGASRLPARLLAQGASLLHGARNARPPVAVDVRAAADGFEAVVTAPDRTGLLADLAAGAGEAGVAVRLVHAMSLDGQALDFFVLSTPGAAAGAGGETDRSVVAARIEAAFRSRAANAERRAPRTAQRIGDRRALFDVTPKVEIDADAAPGRLLVEIEGRDRPGLLHDLAAAIADAGGSIGSAHIATYGERAVDVFYVTPIGEAERFREDVLQDIERRLMAVLSECG